MDKYTLTSLLGFLNELEDLFGGFVCGVKEYLGFLVHPEERQVDDTHVLPQITHLLTSAIHNVRDFVGDYEF
jgi:hypothetical protein